ncbi:TetR family transcriptional regulator [Alteraurantiacibacter palmitatis]|uniref:TetR family transcriptional regulator n=1 Tax=Alteraurantiacibacter palmitatis TaxID=2054628 RepID=A0ABV7EAH7_9SPHN
MSIRKRLSPEESRAAALAAARDLLVEAGPQAVTLKAVAARIDRTHANLLHHFGSAAGLQKALAAQIAGTVCDAISDAVRATRGGAGTPRQAIDLAFDAFGREGGGALASWMLLSGNEDALDPIVETIHQLVDELHPHELQPGANRLMHEAAYTLVLMALGDALLGDMLSASFRVQRNTARDKAAEMIVAALKQSGEMRG